MSEAAVAENVNEQIKSIEEKAGKYLTFQLEKEFYGLEILKIQEIIQMMNITRVPRAPEFIRGVINLRGKIIPVINLRKKFIMEFSDDTQRTCVIVVRFEHNARQVTLGIVVDEVSEVINITGEQIEEAPEFGTEIDTGFILGMGKVDKKVVILLDIEKVLSTGEISLVSKVAGAETST